MNTTSRLRLTLAIATGMAISSISGAAFAAPNTDVYAYPGTQPANGLAVGPVTVVRAPAPGLVTAYADFGTAATGLSFERPIVVAAPFVGRGYNHSVGASLGFIDIAGTQTGLTAGN